MGASGNRTRTGRPSQGGPSDRNSLNEEATASGAPPAPWRCSVSAAPIFASPETDNLLILMKYEFLRCHKKDHWLPEFVNCEQHLPDFVN